MVMEDIVSVEESEEDFDAADFDDLFEGLESLQD
jgi:hypothetical protein